MRSRAFILLFLASLLTFASLSLATDVSGPVSGTWQPPVAAQTDSGGPDAWGYTWKQTADPGGPPFAWKEISSIGTLVTGIGDDNYVGPFPIGFPFHYYWYDVTQYWIGSNGYLEFGPPFNAASPFPTSIPLTTPPNNFLGVYMADFDLSVAGPTCHRWNNADSCVIQWTNVPYWGTTPIGSHTFEIILSRLDSNITFEYGVQTGISAYVSFLVGIENYSGMMGLMHSHDVYPTPNNTIKWYHPSNPTVVVHDMAAIAAANANSEGFFVLQGGTVTPTGIVQNVGNTTESNFQVNCTIQLVGGSVVYNQTQTVTTPLAPNAETTLNFTPSWTASTTGTYFFKVTVTLAGDLNPNNNLKTTEMGVLSLPGTMLYDDGTAEWGWSWQRDNDILANHFVPPVYPVTIDSVRFYIGDAWWISSPHPFVAQVLDDDGPGGTPGTVLFTQTVNTPTVNQWYAASPNLSITSGGFYVGWQMQDSLTPPLGVDNTIAQPKSRQGWEFTGANWTNSPAAEYQDLMIRARISDLSSPMLDMTLTPLNPPIVIPGNGGRFNFNISVVRNIGPQAPYTVWARIKNPDGSYTNPTLGPVAINTPVGVTITRQRSQSIPGSWPAGVYCYLGYVNTTYSYPAYDSSLFTFTKSAAADGGPFVNDASCTGEPFPCEVMASLAPAAFDLEGAHPNPFNPATVISYQMPEARFVSLRVYDISGRLVTTLVDGWRQAGVHEVTFDGSGLSSGLYFVRMQAGNYAEVQKMMMLK